MNTKRFLGLSLGAALIVLTMAGQTSRPVGAQDATATAAATYEVTPVATAELKDGKPQTLNVYNWTTYVAEDTISNFEKLYNVKVVYDTYGGMDELLAKMQAGNPGYDVVVPADYTVEQMVKSDLLEEIDLSKIPNFTKYASAQFKNPAYDPENKHCIAYQWGTLGIGYNIKKTGRELKTWADVFSPEFKGRVGLYNVARDTLAIGLIVLGKDLNTTNKDDLEAAKQWLLDHKDVIGTFHEDDGQTKLARGDVDIVMEYSGDIFQTMTENPDIRYMVPEEGSIIWTDNLCIPKGNQNLDLAYKFLNYIYDPKVGADISNYTSYASPNQGAIDFGFIPKETLDNPSVYPTGDVMKKLVYLVDVGDAQATWDEVFADLKAQISQ